MDFEEQLTNSYKQAFQIYSQALLTFNGILIGASLGLMALSKNKPGVEFIAGLTTIVLLMASIPIVEILYSYLGMYKYLRDLYRKLNQEDRLPTDQELQNGTNMAGNQFYLNDLMEKIARYGTYIGIFLFLTAIYLYLWV